MNPWPMVLADLRAMRWSAAVVVALIALAVAIGIAVAAQERGLRGASARAAEDFDLLVAAPGSATQLVLTTVYLQPAALPLLDGAVLRRLAADRRVAQAAPIAFGDIARGYPVVGTTAAFATRWGRLAPAQGRVFAAEGEAVVGAEVRIALGETVTPAHGRAGPHAAPGETDANEAAHRHEGVGYTVVGRMPRLGTPWDRAVLVPVESVWEVHGLGNGHAQDPAPLGPPFDAAALPGVPAVVVRPASVADAYALRGAYRGDGATALFPAEVLVSLYRTMGDVRDVMVLASALDNVTVILAVLLLVATLASLRRRRYAVLRALGAPPLYVLLVAWLGAVALIGAGCLGGLGLGWLAARTVAWALEQRTGLAVPVSLGWEELRFAALLLAVGGVVAVLPGLAAARRDVAAGLREG